MVEKISAVTLRVANMQASEVFYRDLVGLKVVYGGEDAYFSSLSTKDGTNPILNLEQGKPVLQWGHLIFRVSDVDVFWAYLTEGDSVRSPLAMLHGVNAIFTCGIQMATNCHSHIRSSLRAII